MGNIDKILQNAVNQANTPKEETKEVVQDIIEIKEESPKEQLDLTSNDKEPAKKEKKKIKVKAYGKEKELEVGDEDFQAYVQKGYAAEEKWKEAQEALRKASEIDNRNQEFAENFKKDPEKAMELLLGRETLDLLSEKRILRAMEMEKLSPVQREEYEAYQKLEAYKKEIADFEAKKQKQEEERQIDFFEAQFKDMTTKALQKIGYEKPSKLVLNRFLMTIRPFLAHADGPATEEDMDILAHHFAKTMDEEKTEHLTAMDGPALAKYLGKENVEKIRKYLMNGASKPISTQVEQPKKDLPKGNLRDYIKSL
ncbi:MAG TPA: hypothetical protein PLP33_28670 [Leptospiraceae bacterium]|nr:hypothetical protein [Leptospiraceae bacterium]